MLTFKEYLDESIGSQIFGKLSRALLSKSHTHPNTGELQAKVDQHMKRGQYHQAQTVNMHLASKDRRGPTTNPWVEKGKPNTSSVPGVYQKTKTDKFPTMQRDPNTINMPGKLHPEPKKHQFHN